MSHNEPIELAYNPHLSPWERPAPNSAAGKGQIDQPGQVRNIIWQTRAYAPTAYENALGDALTHAFENGAKTPTDIVTHFNQQGFRTADGLQWTETRFLSLMQELGA